jgi:osmoprotectant transport system substrate-binding protein
LDPYGFNNTYTLAVAQDSAEKYNLVTFSDIANVAGDFTLGCDFEFLDRPDGLPGLSKLYDMNFKSAKGMDHGIKYRALSSGDVNIINSYSTDGQLKVFNLKILDDDKGFFPPYHAATVIRQDLLDRVPDLEQILNQLGGKIDAETMQDLNARVDSEGLKAETVAREFLISADLIRK